MQIKSPWTLSQLLSSPLRVRLAQAIGVLVLCVWLGLALRSYRATQSIGSSWNTGTGHDDSIWYQTNQEDATLGNDDVQVKGWSRPVIQDTQVEEIQNRLTGLARQVEKSKDHWKVAADKVLNSVKDQSGQQTRDLERALKQTREDLLMDTKRLVEDLQHEERRENGRIIQDLKREMNTLKTDYTSELRRIEATVKEHSKRYGSDMTLIRARLDGVEKELSKMFDEKLWLDTLEQLLPTFVPYMRGRDLQPHVDPQFWTDMKKLFSPEDSSSHRHQAYVQPTWKDFVEENHAKLDEWLRESLGRRAETNYIDKNQFRHILVDEIAELKKSLYADMEARAKQGDKEMAQKIKHMWAEAAHRRESDDIQPMVDEKDLTFTVSQLIDHALLKYSKDTIAKTDYALVSSGATIVPDQTSPSLALSPSPSTSTLGRLFSGLVRGSGSSSRAQARDPRVALNARNEPGFCWAFAGQYGTLGIALSRTIMMTDVTVEHVAKELVPRDSLTSAPRQMEVVSCFSLEEKKTADV